MEFKLTHGVIRPWRRGDENSLWRHADNPNISQNLRDSFPSPCRIDDARAWVERNVDDPYSTQFAIVCDGSAAGGIGIDIGTDIFRRSAEIGYWLGEKYWGRGITTEAVQALTRHAFQTYDLAHIFAGVFEPNRASARVLEKAGYVYEGRRRMHVTKNGATMDELLYGVVSP